MKKLIAILAVLVIAFAFPASASDFGYTSSGGGGGAGDMTAAVYDPVGGAAQVAFESDLISGGTVTGQMAYWDGTDWTAITSTGLFWDNANGRLGIGTATPSFPLQIISEVAKVDFNFLMDFQDLSGNGFLLGATNTGQAAAVIASRGGNDGLLFRTVGGGKLEIETGGTGFTRGTPNVTILGTGEFGINTTTPDTQLHVVDNTGRAQQTWSYTEGSVESTWTTDSAGVSTLDTTGGTFVFAGNLVIGIAEAGVDYALIFDGETNDGTVTYDEDNDILDFDMALSFSSGYTRHIVINPSASTLGPTAPTATTTGTARGFLHDADNEQSFVSVEIPTDWDGVSDIDFEIVWSPVSGDAIADGETVIHLISYRSITDMDAVDNGTVVDTSVTYTQSGAGTDKQQIESEIVLDFDSATQPLTAGDIIHIIYSYDATTSTYSGGPIVYHWEIKYTSNALPYG